MCSSWPTASRSAPRPRWSRAWPPVQSIATLGFGSHTIVAQYQSDSIFGPNSGSLTQSISQGIVTVTVSSNNPTPTYGQSLSFAANVATTISGGPAPTGRVQFTVDNSPFGQSVLLVNGIASSGIVSGLSAGSHDINAQYLGDSTYAAASSDLTDQVSPAHLAIVPDNLTMNAGQPLPNLTWHFTGFVPGETALTTNVAGSPNLVTTASPASLPGPYPITVKDIGTLSAPNYDFPTADFGTGTLTVTQKPIPSVSVNSALPTSTYGQSVSFTVTVSPTGGGATPTGTVQFLVDGSPIGSAVTLVSGGASSIGVANLSAGMHNVVANYSGDGTYSLSTGSVSQNVNKVHLAIVPDNASRAVGQSNPTLTAHYTGFKLNETAASAAITGSPMLTTTANPGSKASTYPITVVSAGTLSAPNYDFPAGSFGTGTLTVTPGSATVTVGSTASTSTYGHSVSFTVTVSPLGSAPTPTGMVQFLVDGSPLGGTVALAAGVATSTSVANLAAGTHNIVVNYVGDTNYSTSSGTFTQTVNKVHLSIVPDNLSMNAGQLLPNLTWHYTGFALNETATSAGISGTTTPTTTAMTSKLGTYPITVTSAGTLSAKNYDFPTANFGSGVLTVRDVSTSDFYGVGHAEQAVFHPSNAQWSVNPPGGSPLSAFGAPNLFDIPVPGDYDGVGHTEQAVFRPSTAQWLVMGPNGGHLLGTFGATNLFDIPVPGDYDGVGHTEMAVFRPSTAQWIVMGPNGPHTVTFGATNLFDIPVPGDYDGVGHTEMAVFRPSTGQWFVMGPNGGHLLGTFGATKLFDLPVPGDYDGVGHTEMAVFRPSTGQWFVLGPIGGHSLPNFGATNLFDIPASGPAGYLLAKKVIGGPHIQSLGTLGPASSAAATPFVAIAPSDQELSSTGVLGAAASGKKKLQAAWLSALDQLNDQVLGRLDWL